MSESEAKERLKEAAALLELWLDPMKLPCRAPAHQGPGILGCTCRNVELHRRTFEFLARSLLNELASIWPYGPTVAELIGGAVDLECTGMDDHDGESCEKCERLERRIVVAIRAVLHKQLLAVEKRVRELDPRGFDAVGMRETCGDAIRAMRAELGPVA